MTKKFSAPKIEYQLVAERSEANQNSLTFPFWCAGLDSNQRSPKAWVLQTHVFDHSTTDAFYA